MTGDDIKKASLAELRTMQDRGELLHDPHAPEGDDLGADFWAGAVLKEPENKKAVSIRLDRDVLDWFKGQGQGYQTKMNSVLRTYMEAMERQHR